MKTKNYLTEERFKEILEERRKISKKRSIFFVYFFIIIIFLIAILTMLKLFIAGVFMDKAITVFDKVTLEKNQKYVVEWFYQCPSYQYQYFNCQRDLAYQNITGYYCNKTIICENSYKIHLKDNRTE